MGQRLQESVLGLYSIDFQLLTKRLTTKLSGLISAAEGLLPQPRGEKTWALGAGNLSTGANGLGVQFTIDIH